MKIRFTSPVRHNGEDHAEGDVADLPAKDAQALIDAGAAVARERGGGKTADENQPPNPNA